MARDTWTDERLDDLNVRVDHGFDRVDRQLEGVRAEFPAVRSEMKEGFASARTEMRDEFAALRDEMKEEFAAVRGEIKHEFAAVRAEMRAEFAAVRAEMRAEFAAVRAESKAEIGLLRTEMREGFDRIDARFDALQRSMLTAVVAISGCMITGFAAIFAALV